MNKKIIIIAIALLTVLSVVACSSGSSTSEKERENSKIESSEMLYSYSELFTERDLEQEADLKNAIYNTVEDDTDIEITKEGVYVISGEARNVTINVNAGDEDKVQLVLDGLSITNSEEPCIWIENADKVFITTTSGTTNLTYEREEPEEGYSSKDSAIFSRSDITLNGTGVLNVKSVYNGITGKDDIKITGGTYNIESEKNSVRANDSIRISDGTLNLNAGTDGLHAENSDDTTKGYIYIKNGTISIDSADDAIHAISRVQIDGGTFNIKAAEGIEGTYIQINDGTINIEASDDGINAAKKSDEIPTVEINGGTLTINMGPGDTDGIDSNGNIIINGGTISVTGNSTFDYEKTAEFNGGTIIVNGNQVDTIPNQFMGGGRGGFRQDGNNNGNFNFKPGDDTSFERKARPQGEITSGDRIKFENGEMPSEGFFKNRERKNEI